MKTTFSTRIALYFGSLFLAAIGIPLAIWYFGWQAAGIGGARSQLLRDATGDLEFVADSGRAAITRNLAQRRGDILIAAENKIISRQLGRGDRTVQSDLERVFNRLQRAYPDQYRELLIVAPEDGLIRASTGPEAVGQAFADPGLIARMSKPGVTELIERLSMPHGKTAWAIVRQIHAPDADGYPGSTLVGVLVAIIEPHGLLNWRPDDYQDFSAPKGSSLLLDAGGRPLLGEQLASFLQPGADALPAGFEGTLIRPDADGREWIVVYRNVPLAGTQSWQLVHYISKDDALAPLSGSLSVLALSAVAIAALALGLISLLAVRLTRPLENLMASARRLGAGDLAARAPVDDGGSVEIAALAAAFDTMAAGVQSAQQTLEGRVAERTAELARSETRHRTLFESMRDAYVRVDMGDRIVESNRAFQEMLGYAATEVGDLDYRRITPVRWHAHEARIIREQVLPQGVSDTYEKEYIHRSGRIFPVELRTYLIRDEAGSPTGMWAIVRDISERKAAERALEDHRQLLEQQVAERTAALQEAKELAETANRAKSTFLANMSHELRTPMNAIMGLTDIVLRNTGDAREREQLGKVMQASRHLLGVINDILDLSKIEADRLLLEDAPFVLDDLLDNLTSLLAHKADEKGLELRCEVAAEARRMPLRGDAMRLSQVLVNLASNAIKFTERGSVRVCIDAEPAGPGLQTLHFSVIDTGIGIDAQHLPRLFRAFEQADASMTRRFGGSGLGLVISQRLVAMMGGHIDVDSEPGTGSNFRFAIRLHTGTAPAKAPADADHGGMVARLRAEFAGRRVLLVEDEPINCEVSRLLLEEAGLAVDVAEDGVEAVELAAGHGYALILMDIQMPRMNGLDATRVIRKLPGGERTPILAMTANAFDEDRQRCAEAGMDAHIGKPIDPELLFATLYEWLSRRRG